MMQDMQGTQLRVGQHIVISWSGGSLQQATITGLTGWRRGGGTLILALPDGREYRRRNYTPDQALILR